MQKKNATWYKEIWTLDIKNHSWTEETKSQVDFQEEFDVVLNMADGAIGYLENEEENLKIFDVVAKALRPGGKHIMDIMSADYADNHFPCDLWSAGENGITLSKFEWDKDSQIMLYGQNDFAYGEMLTVPQFESGDPIRLYHKKEVEEIMRSRGMAVKQTFADFTGTPADTNSIQMIVFSEKS